MQKIKNIEFLRVLFMFSAVWMHMLSKIAKATNLDIYNTLAYNANNGGKAVDGFFLISGFLLY